MKRSKLNSANETMKNKMEKLPIHMENFRVVLNQFRDLYRNTLDGRNSVERSPESSPEEVHDIGKMGEELDENIKQLKVKLESLLTMLPVEMTGNVRKQNLYDTCRNNYNSIIDFLGSTGQVEGLNDPWDYKLTTTKPQYQLVIEFEAKTEKLLNILRRQRFNRMSNDEKVKELFGTSKDDGQLDASTSKQELQESETPTDLDNPEIAEIKTEIKETLDLMETFNYELKDFVKDSSHLGYDELTVDRFGSSYEQLSIELHELENRFKYLLDGSFGANLYNQCANLMPGLLAIRDNYNNIIAEFEMNELLSSDATANLYKCKDTRKFKYQFELLNELILQTKNFLKILVKKEKNQEKQEEK